MVNFTQCGLDFTQGVLANNSTILGYVYRGPVTGIAKHESTQITYAGCRALCGTHSEYYEWSAASQTITTWVLPIIGVLLQAPFESNKAWGTFAAIARWVGSPIVSLSYILWNVRVLGKCAIMVDMSVPYSFHNDKSSPASKQDTEEMANFKSMRDSLYILGSMNQFSMSRYSPTEIGINNRGDKAAEGLLRIILFSKALKLQPDCNQPHCGCNDHVRNLKDLREVVAKDFRNRRKRGIVPVFISAAWFLFALALSIQAAFSDIGENETAHDLAIGFLLGWLPVLILCSIVDRNPTDPEGNLQDLNELVITVSKSLLDDKIFHEYELELKANFSVLKYPDYTDQNTVRDGLGRIRALCRTIVDLHDQAQRSSSTKDDIANAKFFTQFSGQGRVRWHYGCAHSILSDIEDAYIAPKGRNWLAHEAEARPSLVLSHIGTERGLVWWDPRELWQMASATLVVLGTCFGAFILSYNTPTVGIGCRSGGYLIFATIAVLLLLTELLMWWIDWRKLLPGKAASARRYSSTMGSGGRDTPSDDIKRSRSYSVTPLEGSPNRTPLSMSLNKSLPSLPVHQEVDVSSLLNDVKGGTPSISTRGARNSGNLQRQGHESDSHRSSSNERHASLLTASYQNGSLPHRHDPAAHQGLYKLSRSHSSLDYISRFVLMPIEILNTGWLTYICLAQTFGSYRNCECLTSAWGLGEGGYLDFQQESRTNTPSLRLYWGSGTGLGVAVMTAGLVYVVLEWASQSHMNTLDFEDSMIGLRRVRTWRKVTYPIRGAARVITDQLTAQIDGVEKWIRVQLKMKPAIEKRRQSLRWTIQSKGKKQSSGIGQV